MDILQLRYFLEVAETENITRAAEKIHIAQPALSSSILKLEDKMSVKLFDRVGKNIKLNRYGKYMAKQVTKALQILDNLSLEMKELKKPLSGTIRLRVMAGSSVISALLASFYKEYPEIHFELVQQESGDRESLCITAPENGVLPETNRLLLEEEVMLAVPRSHPLAEKGGVALSAMKDEQFLSLDPTKPLRKMTDIFCRAAGFSPVIVMQTDNPSMLREAIEQGLGVAFVPAITWSELQKSSSVVLLHIIRPVCHRKLCIIWNKDRYLTEAERCFIDYATTYFLKLIDPIP